jgi:hypothetical protein
MKKKSRKRKQKFLVAQVGSWDIELETDKKIIAWVIKKLLK